MNDDVFLLFLLIMLSSGCCIISALLHAALFMYLLRKRERKLEARSNAEQSIYFLFFLGISREVDRKGRLLHDCCYEEVIAWHRGEGTVFFLIAL